MDRPCLPKRSTDWLLRPLRPRALTIDCQPRYSCHAHRARRGHSGRRHRGRGYSGGSRADSTCCVGTLRVPTLSSVTGSLMRAHHHSKSRTNSTCRAMPGKCRSEPFPGALASAQWEPFRPDRECGAVVWSSPGGCVSFQQPVLIDPPGSHVGVEQYALEIYHDKP